MTIPIEDRAKYQNREGDLSTNVLGICAPKMKFTYISYLVRRDPL